MEIRLNKMINNNAAENQLLGALYVEPELFNKKEMGQLKPDDFSSQLKKVIFQTLENMFYSEMGHFSIQKIETYLSEYPNSFEIYMKDKDGVPQGRWYLEKLSQTGDKDNFSNAFDTVKKFTLLRNLSTAGLDITRYYNINEVNPTIIEKQNKWLKEHTLQQISEIILSDVEGAVLDTSSTFNESYDAGFEIDNLIQTLQTIPDFGAPMPIHVLNEALRGMRLGKFYIYSAGTGRVCPLQ